MLILVKDVSDGLIVKLSITILSHPSKFSKFEGIMDLSIIPFTSPETSKYSIVSSNYLTTCPNWLSFYHNHGSKTDISFDLIIQTL